MVPGMILLRVSTKCLGPGGAGNRDYRSLLPDPWQGRRLRIPSPECRVLPQVWANAPGRRQRTDGGLVVRRRFSVLWSGLVAQLVRARA